MKVPEGLTRAEQETFFRKSAADDVWDFYTRDPKFKRLLERRGYIVKADHQGLWSATIPQKALSVRSVRKHVEPTPEQRAKWQEQGKFLDRGRRKTTPETPDDPQVDPDPETRF